MSYGILLFGNHSSGVRAIIRVASYNIHRAVGVDRRKSLSRIVDVLGEVNADVVALQEVESAVQSTGFAAEHGYWLRHGYRMIFAHTLIRDGARYGNALLTRLPAARIQRLDISQPRREPRLAMALELNGADNSTGRRFTLIATHLGLTPSERLAQVEQLLDFDRDITGPVLLLGDLNLWSHRESADRRLAKRFNGVDLPPSFPSRFPVMRLDRIFYRGAIRVVDCGHHASRLSRRASDHLPIYAQIEVG